MVDISKGKNDTLARINIVEKLRSLDEFNSVEKLIIGALMYTNYGKYNMIVDRLRIFKLNDEFLYKSLINKLKDEKLDSYLLISTMSKEDFDKFYRIFDKYGNSDNERLDNLKSKFIDVNELTNLNHVKILNLQKLIDNILNPIGEYYMKFREFKIPLKFIIKDTFNTNNPMVQYLRLDELMDDGNFILFKANIIDSRVIMNDIRREIFNIEYSICHLDNSDRYILIGNTTTPKINKLII